MEVWRRKEKAKPLPSGQHTWCAKRFSANCVLSSGVARAFGARNENYELYKNHNHLTFIWLSD
jgi:hypothetical protein